MVYMIYRYILVQSQETATIFRRHYRGVAYLDTIFFIYLF